MDYKLNQLTALQKKFEACKRENINISTTDGINFVVKLNTASFEATRNVLFKCLYADPRNKKSTRHLSYKVDKDQSDLIVSEVINVKHWSAVKKPGKPNISGKCSITINIYRTTSKILINGSDSSIFMDVFAPNLTLFLENHNDSIQDANANIQLVINAAVKNNKDCDRKYSQVVCKGLGSVNQDVSQPASAAIGDFHFEIDESTLQSSLSDLDPVPVIAAGAIVGPVGQSVQGQCKEVVPVSQTSHCVLLSDKQERTKERLDSFHSLTKPEVWKPIRWSTLEPLQKNMSLPASERSENTCCETENDVHEQVHESLDVFPYTVGTEASTLRQISQSIFEQRKVTSNPAPETGYVDFEPNLTRQDSYPLTSTTVKPTRQSGIKFINPKPQQLPSTPINEHKLHPDHHSVPETSFCQSPQPDSQLPESYIAVKPLSALYPSLSNKKSEAPAWNDDWIRKEKLLSKKAKDLDEREAEVLKREQRLLTEHAHDTALLRSLVSTVATLTETVHGLSLRVEDLSALKPGITPNTVAPKLKKKQARHDTRSEAGENCRIFYRTGETRLDYENYNWKKWVRTENPGVTPRVKTENPGVTPRVRTENPGVTPRVKTENPGVTPRVKTKNPGVTPRVKTGNPGVTLRGTQKHKNRPVLSRVFWRNRDAGSSNQGVLERAADDAIDRPIKQYQFPFTAAPGIRRSPAQLVPSQIADVMLEPTQKTRQNVHGKKGYKLKPGPVIQGSFPEDHTDNIYTKFVNDLVCLDEETGSRVGSVSEAEGKFGDISGSPLSHCPITEKKSTILASEVAVAASEAHTGNLIDFANKCHFNDIHFLETLVLEEPGRPSQNSTISQ